MVHPMSVGGARAMLADISRAAGIANTPAGAELSSMARSMDEAISSRGKVAGSVERGIEQANTALTRSGAAFPSDADIASAQLSLKPAAWRLRHPVLRPLADHSYLSVPLGAGLGASALIGAIVGGAELIKRREERAYQAAVRTFATEAELPPAAARRLAARLESSGVREPPGSAMARYVNGFRRQLEQHNFTLPDTMLADVIAADMTWDTHTPLSKAMVALAPQAAKAGIDDAALSFLAAVEAESPGWAISDFQALKERLPGLSDSKLARLVELRQYLGMTATSHSPGDFLRENDWKGYLKESRNWGPGDIWDESRGGYG